MYQNILYLLQVFCSTETNNLGQHKFGQYFSWTKAALCWWKELRLKYLFLSVCLCSCMVCSHLGSWLMYGQLVRSKESPNWEDMCHFGNCRHKKMERIVHYIAMFQITLQGIVTVKWVWVQRNNVDIIPTVVRCLKL